MSASLHTSPTCRAQVLQQSQPSMRRLTPGGQVGATTGHSQGHMQYCVRLYTSTGGDVKPEAGGVAVEFWEKAWREGGVDRLSLKDKLQDNHKIIIIQLMYHIEWTRHYTWISSASLGHIQYKSLCLWKSKRYLLLDERYLPPWGRGNILNILNPEFFHVQPSVLILSH